MFLWAEKCQEKISNFERHSCLHQKWGTGVKLPWLSSTVQNDTSCQDSNQVENLASKKDHDLVMSNLPISTCLKGKFTKQCVHIFYQKEAFQECHDHLPFKGRITEKPTFLFTLNLLNAKDHSNSYMLMIQHLLTNQIPKKLEQKKSP